MWRWFCFFAGLLVSFLGVLLFRAVTVPSRQFHAPELVAGQRKGLHELKVSKNLEILAMAIQADNDLLKLRRVWAAGFPRIHQHLPPEIVNQHTLIFKWQGLDLAAEPVLFLAHQDVVPAGDLAAWTHPPSSGVIEEGFIWGRGTMDDRVGVVALMAAAEALIEQGYRPRRTVYFVFGHDEEVGGTAGAGAAAQLFKERGLRFAWVLDEGMMVTRGLVPGVKERVAIVGIAEKGYAELELVASGEGGHGSMPHNRHAIQILLQALERLERNPLPLVWAPMTEDLFMNLAREAEWPYRLIFSNLWFFRPVLQRVLATQSSTGALVRTTVVPTLLQAGVAPNVLATEATAVLNVRLLPGTTIEEVLAQVRERTDDPRVQVRVRPGAQPASGISSVEAEGYEMIKRALMMSHLGTWITPGLLVGATDSRHFQELTTAIYRFLPVEVGAQDLKRIHGVDERLAVDNFERILLFYQHLIGQL